MQNNRRKGLKEPNKMDPKIFLNAKGYGPDSPKKVLFALIIAIVGHLKV